MFIFTCGETGAELVLIKVHVQHDLGARRQRQAYPARHLQLHDGPCQRRRVDPCSAAEWAREERSVRLRGTGTGDALTNLIRDEVVAAPGRHPRLEGPDVDLGRVGHRPVVTEELLFTRLYGD
jgi:hypothetical protein